jgi:SAM-dependent methyltransferase
MDRWTRKALCGVNRSVGRWLPVGALSRSVPGIPGRVHVDDQMFRSDAPEHVRHYVEDAQSAMANLEASLAAVGRSPADVDSCLDFACGYGRVTRWLARALGPARVTAADVDPQAVRFCAHEFGVEPMLADRDPSRMRLRPAYDLVFVGSLVTHLSLDAGAAMLRALSAAVLSGGLLVFSTQGKSCLAHLGWYGPEFSAAEEEFRAGVRRDGAYFVPYRRTPDYGITIHTQRYVEALVQSLAEPPFRLVRFAERGWDQHQDVWTCQRPGDESLSRPRADSSAASAPSAAAGAAPPRGDRP